MSEDKDEIPIEEVKLQDLREGDEEVTVDTELPEEEPSGESSGELLVDKTVEKEESEGLSGRDFVFLIGLALFILYLALIHPYTPEIVHSSLIFWMSISMLFLSMAPDYVNREAAREWWGEYKETKLEGLYERIYSVAQNSDRYFGSDNFFVLGIIFTVLAVVALFWTGKIPEPFFGVSYGLFMRAILA